MYFFQDGDPTIHIPECPDTEEDPDVSEIALRNLQKVDSINVINQLRIKPSSKSRFAIPLCRLQYLLLVRPISEVNVQRLENDFVMGYRDGDRVLYVSAYNGEDVVLTVTEDICDSWSSHWRAANDSFEKYLAADSDLKVFSNKMFFVYEGNHRLSAWWRHINKHHGSDPTWHISVDCIVLDARKQNNNLLNAMNNINW